MHFPTTSWNLVKAARKIDGRVNDADWNRFVTAYWRPVYYFLRARGYSTSDAEELTQGFFSNFWEKDWGSRADEQRGRFRSFLLTVLKRYVADQGANRVHRQSAFEMNMVSVSALVTDEDRSFEPPSSETPEDIFMRRWALSVIETCRMKLKQWCNEQGRPDWHGLFEAIRLPPPGKKGLSQRDAADHFRISRDQVRHGLKMAEQRFVEFLREEVGSQVLSEEETESELHQIDKYLGT